MGFVIVKIDVTSVEYVEGCEEAAKKINLLGSRNVVCNGLVDGDPDDICQRNLPTLVKELLTEKIMEAGIEYTDTDGCYVQIPSTQGPAFMIAVPASRFARR